VGSARVSAGGDWSVQIAGVPEGSHGYDARATDAAGNVSPRSAVRAVEVRYPVQAAPPPPTPLPAPSAQPAPAPTATPDPVLPPPVAQKSVNVEVKSGRVLIKLPGTNRFVALGAGQQIPLGTTLDTTKGRIRLTAAADKKGKTQTADFYAGIFRIGQTKGAAPVTELTLVEPLSCTAKASGAGAAAAKKKTRKLWGDGAGKFRTRGQYSAATVRGTLWLTEDRCGTTLTRVRRGTVEVRDLVKRRTVLVKAGRQYLARAKRR
jgi:hypothetical protein